MNYNGFDRPLAVTVVAFVPLLAYWALIEFGISPPFWHYWHHWELTYYYTSMDLVDGFAVYIASGPGTPIQLLGYPVLKLLGTQPDKYPQFLLAVHAITLVIAAVAAYLFQRAVFDRSNRTLSIACIWFYFSFGASPTYLQVWAPEALYFPFGLLFVVAFLKMLEALPEMKDIQVLTAGICLGLLLSIKFNFLPWVPAFYVVLLVANFRRPIWTQIRSMLMASLGIVTAFLLITRPVSDHYEYMVRFLLGLVFTDGTSEPGQRAPVTLDVAFGNWSQFALSVWPSILIILLVVIAYVWYARVSKDKLSESVKQVRAVLLFAAVSTVFSLATISRLYNDRYMLPIGLCGLLLCAAVVRAFSGNIPRSVQRSILVVSFAVLVFAMQQNLGQNRSHIDDITRSNQKLQAKIDQVAVDIGVEDPVIIYGWPLPHPAAAMRHQPYYEKHQRDLDALYPNAGYHVSWRRYIRIPADRDHWDMAVFPETMLSYLRDSRLPIVNDVSKSSHVSLFENFEVADRVDDFIIILPGKDTSP